MKIGFHSAFAAIALASVGGAALLAAPQAQAATIFSYVGQATQTLTVTTSGIYQVEAAGAQGAGQYHPTSAYPEFGGWGAELTGNVKLLAGEQIVVYVGGTSATGLVGLGGCNSCSGATGANGGGGSFIALDQASVLVPILVAGGGGGAGVIDQGGPGLSTTNGGAGGTNPYGPYGPAAGGVSGGNGATGPAAEAGAGGDGFNSGNVFGGAGQAQWVAFFDGVGPQAQLESGGGGGGGYSGGGGGQLEGGGGGGGSYANSALASDVVAIAGANGDNSTPSNYYSAVNGFVEVTFLSGAVPEPATWVMQIIGVAMIGFAARRRRRGVAVVA